MRMNDLPSAQRLREAFSYCPATGDLRWKIRRKGKNRVGEIAGSITRGHVIVVFEMQRLFAHRIIWKMQTGAEAGSLIDHIDGDGANNRWANLRLADHKGNSCNSKLYSNSTSGIKGVSYDVARGKWCAYITVDQKKLQIGRFSSKQAAASARVSAADKLHGEFARHDLWEPAS